MHDIPGGALIVRDGETQFAVFDNIDSFHVNFLERRPTARFGGGKDQHCQ
jgi:hypothetical protein